MKHRIGMAWRRSMCDDSRTMKRSMRPHMRCAYCLPRDMGTCLRGCPRRAKHGHRKPKTWRDRG